MTPPDENAAEAVHEWDEAEAVHEWDEAEGLHEKNEDAAGKAP
ncbi:hypothetical protein EV562_104371 [Streptomyces sp. BK208]|nr:hypothetical protein [Streptomyces sp. BK208]TDT39128.1 hypothetical protein EV562_104371 [Streptomyces sp. BK208]